ncbi:hypothetical protein RJT34_30200 [Clitoria ternatea]|uniref:RING-type domain-containing protein n=1 Tax=Clitoria ternatea TaxID=43366 RepID=A0AAN9EU31_CLITE
MSRNMNNFTPLPGHWQRGVRANDGHTFNNHESYEVPVFHRSHSTLDDTNSGALGPQRFWEVRTPVGLQRVPGLQAPPDGRTQVQVHNGDMGRGFNPWLREIPLQPPQRSTHQTSTQVSPPIEISKSTALSKLKKVVYNPVPKRLARRVSLYYRNKASNSFKEREKEKDEDGKRCAVCLDDFEPKQEVMLTPCSHMFHEDCIVPWLTSKGQCPVCRFVVCERGRGNPSSFNDNDMTNLGHSNIIAGELLSILRAMEEAFQLGSMTY